MHCQYRKARADVRRVPEAKHAQKQEVRQREDAVRELPIEVVRQQGPAASMMQTVHACSHIRRGLGQRMRYSEAVSILGRGC